jgi:hypothetical protein
VQLEQTDPLVVLRMQARHIREVATRVATLDSVIAVAADADPEAAALRESIQQQRLIGATLLVRWLRDRGWLRRGTRVRHGAEVCWLLMDPTAYRWLVTERGRSRRQFDRYLVETLSACCSMARPSGPLDPEHALLRRGGDQPAVGGEHPAEGQPSTALRRG